MRALCLVVLLIANRATFAQTSAARREPIIDMHLHAYLLEPQNKAWPFERMCVNDARPCGNGPSQYSAMNDYLLQGTLAMMKKYNVALGFLSGDLAEVNRWTAAESGRFLPSAGIYDGLQVSVDSVRRAYARGEIKAIGEIGAQYDGIPPNDLRLEPYFALAESLDAPVLIHAAGIGSREPNFRSSNGRPLLLEDVLVRHPRLRLYVENAGYPFLDDITALMYQYPNVYADLSTITWIVPRKAFHTYLQALVGAGFGKRLMFGSDQLYWPEVIGEAVVAIESAKFLTAAQRRDIFYNNAARFLRLRPPAIPR